MCPSLNEDTVSCWSQRKQACSLRMRVRTSSLKALMCSPQPLGSQRWGLTTPKGAQAMGQLELVAQASSHNNKNCLPVASTLESQTKKWSLASSVWQPFKNAWGPQSHFPRLSPSVKTCTYFMCSSPDAVSGPLTI